MAFQSDAFQGGAFQASETLGSLTANAVLLAGRSGSLPAEAILSATTSLSLTADAILLIGRSGSFPVVAVVKKTISVLGQTGDPGVNAMDAILSLGGFTFTGDFSGSAVILGTQSGSSSIDSVLRVERSGVATIDALVAIGALATFPADAVLAATRESQSLIDAILGTARAGSITADAVVLRAAILSLEIGSFIQPYFRVNAVLVTSGVITGTFGVNAVVYRNQSGSLTADAIRSKPRTGSFSANALTNRFGRTISRTIDAYIMGGMRAQHDRGTPPHFDSDPDTAITLAKSLGVYQQGMDLHSVLVALVARVDDLEAN